MGYQEFEQAVLELWITSQVPLTKANVAFYTGVSHPQVDKRLNEMIRHGLLDVDSTDEGELLYLVRGSERKPQGSQKLVRCSSCGQISTDGDKCNRCGQFLNERLASLSKHVGQASSALSLLGQANPNWLAQKEKPTDKSLFVGGALGALGPLGWLYAGSWKEALPAAALWLIILAWMPLGKTLLLLLTPLFVPLSIVIGLVYTSRYNRKQKRSTLLLDDSSNKETPWKG